MPSVLQLLGLDKQMNLFLWHPFTALPFFLFLYFLYKWLFSSHSTTKELPSPRKLPILGNLHQIDRYPHRSLHNLSQQHGEIMLLHFGRKPVLIVSSANAARQIMKTHDSIFSDRPALRIFRQLFYNCKDVATAPYGEYWRQMRSICVLQLLSHKRVQTFHNVREDELAQMIGEIKRSSTVVDLSKMFSRLTSDVICRVAFGMKCNGEKDGINFKELLKKFEELIGGFYVGDYIPWLSWIHHLTGVQTEIKKCAGEMDRFLEGIIQEHLDGLSANRNGEERKNDDRVKDFVDVLLELQQDFTAGFHTDRESIKAILVDIFAAGITTTVATLEWAMSELLRNPRVMEILTKEVRGLTGGKPGISDDDLEKMKYLKAVIKETLRLRTPVPLLLPRISMQEAKIDRYTIAPGTQVIINAWAIHRDQSFWEEAEEFYPERFMKFAMDYKGQDFNFIPFGSGRRGCPGILFGITDIERVLATLMHQFDWALPRKAEGETLDMTEYPGLTIHRKFPLLALATPACC